MCLRVPLLEPLVTLRQGEFGQAVVRCMFRSWTVPRVVRSDRGPEMRNALMQELMGALEVRRTFGSAWTPRHQGAAEVAHKEVLVSMALLMHSVCRAYPQEWPRLLCAVEYLLAITPQGDSGIAARDLETGWSLATGLERALIPFSVPARVTDAQVAVEVFARFREIKSVFDQWKATADGKVSSLINSRRLLRRFDLGEEVFRRKPPAAAPPKSRFQPRAEGPYIVLAQPSDFHVVLGDPTTRETIDGGTWVPVDQVVAFPRRRPLVFENGGGVAGLGPDTCIGRAGGSAARSSQLQAWMG
jgi:hypothetical protein